AHIRHEYKRYLKHDDNNNLDTIFTMQEANDLFSLLDLPSSQDEQKLSLHNIPLIEIPERIISFFNLAKNPVDITYIEAFQSIILEYAENQPTDIHSFIEWWDEYGIKKSLSVDQNQEAMSIITIHKSKGLQYKAIIVPFCRWDLDHRHNQPIIWCQNQSPFDLFGEVPVKYQKSMMESYFREDYLEEKMKSHVDNLNLLYVAFTRAEEVLIAHAPSPIEESKDHDIASLIYRTIVRLEQFTPNPDLSLQSGLSQKENDEIYELGEIPLQPKGDDEPQEKDHQEIKSIQYFCTPVSHQLKLRKEHTDILADLQPGKKMNYGTLMHQLFQQIETPKDLPSAVLAMYHEGLITASQRDEIKRDLSAKISQPQIQKWFSGQWNPMLERDILLPSGKVYRPDRVLTKDDQLIVIDYKFGERFLDQHQQQMITYLDILKRMGYHNPNGYIWYVEQDEVIEV
ncbi:MAG: PD-(D/E)XK nuclease family protein, partial [Bacteroidota bacterium]